MADHFGQRFGAEYSERLQALLKRIDLGSMAGNLARTVAVYLLFLLLEQDSLDKKIAALCHGAEREQLTHRILDRIGSEIQPYIWLKTLMCLIAGFGSYLTMKVVGVNFAEFWGLLTFALNSRTLVRLLG